MYVYLIIQNPLVFLHVNVLERTSILWLIRHKPIQIIRLAFSDSTAYSKILVNII